MNVVVRIDKEKAKAKAKTKNKITYQLSYGVDYEYIQTVLQYIQAYKI